MSGTLPPDRMRRRTRRRSTVLLLLAAAIAAGATVGAMILTVGVQAALQTVGPVWLAEPSGLSSLLHRLEEQADRLERGARDLERFHERRVRPLMASLVTPMARDTTRLTRIALALIREGAANGLDPRLLAAVLLVENPWLDPGAVSPMGAVGLMQVMPFHAGGWGCGGADLRDPETNICHGAKILADYLRRTRGDLHAALLRYNGCVVGTHTPDCHRYPTWVVRRASADWAAEHAWLAAGGTQPANRPSAM